MTAEFWEVLIASLSGVVVSGLITHFTNKWQNDSRNQWNDKQLLREKLEEIAEISEEISRRLSDFYFRLIAAREISDIANFKDESGSTIQRLRMLVNFYAPQLMSPLEKIVQVRDNASPQVGKILERLMKDDGGLIDERRKELNLEMVRAQFQMEKACEEFSEIAAEHARYLVQTSFLSSKRGSGNVFHKMRRYRLKRRLD